MPRPRDELCVPRPCASSHAAVADNVPRADHGGTNALIYERAVRLLLSSATAAGSTAGASPPVVTFVNFFEFADRHHATSTYTSMASQLTTSLRTLRSKEQTSALVDLGVRTDKSTAYDVADLWRGPGD